MINPAILLENRSWENTHTRHEFFTTFGAHFGSSRIGGGYVKHPASSAWQNAGYSR